MGRAVLGADAWGLRPLARARRDALQDVEIDRWASFVARAYLRLHLDIYYRRILQDRAMPDIKRPMELAGLKSRLMRAQRTELAIEDTGKRYDKVLDEIDELHLSAKSHVGQLEGYKADLASTINRMTGGSNGGDPLSESDGQDSAGAKKAPAVAKAEIVTDPAKPLAELKGEALAGADMQTAAAVDVAPVPAAVAAESQEPEASWKGP